MLIRTVCEFAGPLSFLDDIDEEIRGTGLREAVTRRQTPPIFDWLLRAFNFQGISDQAAWEYMRKHGTASWSQVEASITDFPPCSKLRSFWSYADCGYEKTRHTCTVPDRIDACPVPRLRLRNGRLNQIALSFFLFVRDIAESDLVGWIDGQLKAAARAPVADLEKARQEALIGPLREIFGVSDKLLTMALSGLLIGSREQRPLWFEAGVSMIVVDTLVHAFLTRSGILDDCGVPHPYGPACYAEGGCAEIIRGAADRIDARTFNPRFPKLFPRWIQFALWRYCSAEGLDLCNGNRLPATEPCQLGYCHLFRICARKPLKTA
ncbi:hypothetical protein [Bradyrhizobium sp.]|uniref:hypothetical protein n=1 Tax=Bradyrhizobium sp. TaxID=376 RepID=UPI002613B556|nr:hypothetical protein [Bradyrhizobium sp.]